MNKFDTFDIDRRPTTRRSNGGYRDRLGATAFRAGAGYDISASASESKSQATGATKFGNKTIFNGFGGSVGISLWTLLIAAGAVVGGWLLFFRKGGRRV